MPTFVYKFKLKLHLNMCKERHCLLSGTHLTFQWRLPSKWPWKKGYLFKQYVELFSHLIWRAWTCVPFCQNGLWLHIWNKGAKSVANICWLRVVTCKSLRQPWCNSRPQGTQIWMRGIHSENVGLECIRQSIENIRLDYLASPILAVAPELVSGVGGVREVPVSLEPRTHPGTAAWQYKYGIQHGT